MKIKVTEQDIKLGKRVHTCFCPVALALRKSFDLQGAFDVEVGWEYIKMGALGRYKTPTSVRRFIHAFDRRNKVKPFNFQLK